MTNVPKTWKQCFRCKWYTIIVKNKERFSFHCLVRRHYTAVTETCNAFTDILDIPHRKPCECAEVCSEAMKDTHD